MKKKISKLKEKELILNMINEINSSDFNDDLKDMHKHELYNDLIRIEDEIYHEKMMYPLKVMLYSFIMFSIITLIYAYFNV